MMLLPVPDLKTDRKFLRLSVCTLEEPVKDVVCPEQGNRHVTLLVKVRARPVWKRERKGVYLEDAPRWRQKPLVSRPHSHATPSSCQHRQGCV